MSTPKDISICKYYTHAFSIDSPILHESENFIYTHTPPPIHIPRYTYFSEKK